MTEKQYADFFRNKWKMKIIENSEGWEANGFYIRSGLLMENVYTMVT